MPKQWNRRLPELTLEQIERLAGQHGMTDVQVVVTAVDRMEREWTMTTARAPKEAREIVGIGWTDYYGFAHEEALLQDMRGGYWLRRRHPRHSADGSVCNDRERYTAMTDAQANEAKAIISECLAGAVAKTDASRMLSDIGVEA